MVALKWFLLQWCWVVSYKPWSHPFSEQKIVKQIQEIFTYDFFLLGWFAVAALTVPPYWFWLGMSSWGVCTLLCSEHGCSIYRSRNVACIVTTAVCWKQNCERRANGSSDSSATAFYKSCVNYSSEMLFVISKWWVSVSTCLLSMFYLGHEPCWSKCNLLLFNQSIVRIVSEFKLFYLFSVIKGLRSIFPWKA